MFLCPILRSCFYVSQLLTFKFIKENSLTVKQYVENAGGEIISMVRFAVGEGIEKEEEDFAQEVMNQIKG